MQIKPYITTLIFLWTLNHIFLHNYIYFSFSLFHLKSDYETQISFSSKSFPDAFWCKIEFIIFIYSCVLFSDILQMQICSPNVFLCKNSKSLMDVFSYRHHPFPIIFSYFWRNRLEMDVFHIWHKKVSNFIDKIPSLKCVLQDISMKSLEQKLL